MGSEPTDDDYAMLGIGEDADATELRRAWRRLALRWHPDRAGPSSTPIFQWLSAAYSVLADPASRAEYDRRRTAARPRPAAAAHPAGAPRTSAPSGASGGGRSGAAPQASSPAGAAKATTRRRAPGVMLDRLTGQLGTLIATGAARRAEPGVIDLFLGPEELEQGGMATISMRVAIRCPGCGGAEPSGCGRCGGRGTIDELFSAWLAVPPGAAEGTLLAPSALLRGMVQPIAFRVRSREAR